MSKYVFLLGISFVFLFSGCSTSRKLAKPESIRKKPAPQLLFSYLDNQLLAPEGLSTKLKIGYKDRNQSVGFTANVKFRKDSLIWISFKKLGIEAFRAQITPDSIYLINRLEKTYGIYPLHYLNEQYNLPADFKKIESLLFGGIFLPEKMQMDLKEEKENYLITGNGKNFYCNYAISIPNLVLNEMKFRSGDNLLQISFAQYEEVLPTKKFSYLRQINVFNKDAGSLFCELNFSKLDLSIPKDFKFEVPDRYAQMD